MSASADVLELDRELTSPALVADPYPTYERLRRTDPVHWCEPWSQWVVTRYEDVLRVTKDPARFSSSGWEQRFVALLPAAVRAELASLERHYATPVLSTSDPPLHTRLRRLVVKSFTPRVLAAIRPRIEEIVSELLDRAGRSGRIDLIGQVAYPLPAIVIAELLGVPAEERDRVIAWSGDVVAFVGSGRPEPARARRLDESLAEMRAFLEPLIRERRRARHEDLLGLLAAPGADGDLLDDEELVSTCVVLLFAGHETTANLIGNGMLALLRRPEALEWLRAEPALTESALEELLRFDSPVQRLRRVALEDVELGGKLVRRGDLVMAFNGAANRDPDRFPQPDRLDLARADNGHVAFGYGIHFCVGAALTRLEAPIAIRALLDRYQCLRLAADLPARFKPNITFRGLESLVLELR